MMNDFRFQTTIPENATRPDFETALARYLAKLEEAMRHFNSEKPASIRIERGKRYIRIVQYSGSAYGFIDMADGSLWKPASWKGPKKNFSRGSIFDVEQEIGRYGVD